MDDHSNSAPILPKTIIYATDFTPSSENVGRYAALLAKRFDADLLATHAFTLSYPAMEVEAEDGVVKESKQRIDLESALSAAANRFGKGLKRACPVLLDGDPREEIPRLAQEYAPSLIVMGTNARGRMSRGVIGSVAERVLRVAQGPSLIVGVEVPLLELDSESGTAPIQRILYATGLSPAAAACGAPYAVAMAQAFNASLDVLHVVHSEEVASPDRFSETQKLFNTVLQEMVPEHADTIRKPRGLVEVGSAHVRILDDLRKLQIDLLVLSIRKSSHLWLQSHVSGAFHIIANAPCPVLAIDC